MNSTPYGRTDIVNSATPLETRYEGVHPRLFATDAEIEALRVRTAQEPWASFLKRVQVMAESKPGPDFQGDLRPYGEWLAHLAVAFRMTREPRYLDEARTAIRAMAGQPDWTRSLQFGHWASGMALAYDWLYHDLDEEDRARVRVTLADRTERVYKHWAAFADAYSLTYAWNHTGVVHAGFIAAGCAVWGEVEGAGRWLRMALEKLRLLAGALGPDGASAEGQAYGQYHLEYLLKSMWLADGLLGEDFFTGSAYLDNYSLYMVHGMLPRNAWRRKGADGFPIAFIQLSDTDEVHWHGPDSHLRVVAARLRDGRAQWLADETAAAGVCADHACFLNLLAYDGSVKPVPPDGLEPFRHFGDKDLVYMRSGWEPDAALAAFKCGPNSGHHAARHYRHNIAGGHMHPDAGHLMLHAFGEWLLRDDGYTLKMTAYQNTVLVNGIGQTGEGGDWFEDLEMRQGKPEGRIVRAEHHGAYDIVTGDAAPAYKPEAGLKVFYRTLVYFRPRLWLLIDELEAEKDSVFEQRFHSPAPFEAAAGGRGWRMAGKTGELRLVPLGPVPIKGTPFRDPVKGHPPHYPTVEIEALAVRNAEPARKALFVTLLSARAKGAETEVSGTLREAGAGWRVELEGPGFRREVGLSFARGPVKVEVM